MFKKILVGLDNSAASQLIFEQALELAKLSNATLMLLHVLPPFGEDYPPPVYPESDSIYTEALKSYMNQWQTIEQTGLEYLRAQTEKATALGIPTEFSQNVGDPGQLICKIAQSWCADLIIIGRRGRSGLSELLMGSVSNYVLHHAPCSVLTIQGQ
ncbi:universal stress protein [Trichothermofontia sp.]